ncbi:phosphotransferase [Xenococcus sp. PCC 7305]|uniref:phosphotransferase n=1 Tax=Xenococcus sp. PCC 7305 TaxID=102125 RepID=UPI00130E998A|nr:phosphotransferase [Xenococcus sp. PCC 7305]
MIQHNVAPGDFQLAAPIICKESKNYNLVVHSSDRQSFLVKQNRVDREGNTSGHLVTEWLVQKLINNFSELASIQPLMSQVLLFDQPNSILVSVFNDEYISLDDYYEVQNSYDPGIAQTIGANLAQIHRATYQKQEHREFLSPYLRFDAITRLPGFIQRLNRPTPSIFGKVCPDGLDFYKLYQRFPSLNQAVVELYEHIQPACLTHNDLTLDNFIIDTQLNLNSHNRPIKPEQVKIIDWEFFHWGDPAADMGMLVAEYLAEWLNSLVADRNLDLNTTLSLATCPLESITPSLEALLQGYLKTFPKIINDRQDFVKRVVQFAGIGIIDRLSYYVEYHHPFDNESLCKLQVAKNLLCYPEKSIKTIFGNSEKELINHFYPQDLSLV